MIFNCFINCDSELSFVKLSKSQESPSVAFHNSKQAIQLQECYNVRFICHVAPPAYFSSKDELVVKALKRPFLCCFLQPNIDLTQLNCLLTSIMSILNSRPISLHRAQHPHSHLNLVTPHNLMFTNSKQIKMYNINRL